MAVESSHPAPAPASREGGWSTKPLLSVEGAAVLLGQSRSSIYRAIERGDLPIPVLTINGRLRIPRRAVERLLDGDIAPQPAGAWTAH